MARYLHENAFDGVIKGLRQGSHESAKLFDSAAKTVHEAWKNTLKTATVKYSKGALVGSGLSRVKDELAKSGFFEKISSEIFSD